MRLPDWDQRLAAWINAEAVHPFNEADAHCGWFAADAVIAITGIDLVSEWRGKHKTIAGAARALKKAGFEDHIALAASLLPEIAPAFAYRGDLMVIEQDGAFALGVLMGEYAWARGRDGVCLVDRMQAHRAFKVG